MRPLKKYNQFSLENITFSPKTVEVAQRKLKQIEERPAKLKAKRLKVEYLKRKKYTVVKFINIKVIEFATNGTFKCDKCNRVQEQRAQWVIKRTTEQNKVLNKSIWQLIKTNQSDVFIKIATGKINNLIKSSQVFCKSCRVAGK